MPQWARLFFAGWAFWICICISIAIFYVYCFCRISARTGRSWAWGLLVLVPFGEPILVLILAFGDWPNVKRRAKKRK